MGNPRISGRVGQYADLVVDFYNNGVLADPFAIRRIDIYRARVEAQNLFASVPLLYPNDPLYPAPVTRVAQGQYTFSYLVPDTALAPEVYMDVWYFFPTNPAGGAGTGTDIDGTGGSPDIDLSQYDHLLQAQCHRFWLYPNNWYTDDLLTSVRFAFEPLQQRFHVGDKRDLEIGLMPLPLYDYDYNLVTPLIPWSSATIHVETRNAEVLIQAEPMLVGLRQGTFRANPFVVKWRLDTSRFLQGTYRYRITLTLPNGVIQASPWFVFSIG